MMYMRKKHQFFTREGSSDLEGIHFVAREVHLTKKLHRSLHFFPECWKDRLEDKSSGEREKNFPGEFRLRFQNAWASIVNLFTSVIRPFPL